MCFNNPILEFGQGNQTIRINRDASYNQDNPGGQNPNAIVGCIGSFSQCEAFINQVSWQVEVLRKVFVAKFDWVAQGELRFRLVLI